MTKSELIQNLASQLPNLQVKMVENGVKELLESVMLSLEQGERVEVRGFGSFSLHQRTARTGRNPKTGESVKLESKCVAHFKAGKDLKERVDLA